MKELLDNISNYLEIRVELIKVGLQEDLAELASRLIVMAAIIIFVFLAMLAATIGLSRYLNEVTGSSYLGYVIITSFYFLIVVILILSNKYFGLTQNLKLYIIRILEKQEN